MSVEADVLEMTLFLVFTHIVSYATGKGVGAFREREKQKAFEEGKKAAVKNKEKEHGQS